MKIEVNGFQPSKLAEDIIKSSKSSQNLISPFNTYKRELSLFSAITLPLILAACGGGGGGGAAGNGGVVVLITTTASNATTKLDTSVDVTAGTKGDKGSKGGGNAADGADGGTGNVGTYIHIQV